MLSCIIDGMQYMDIPTLDMPGAFMQADMDEEVVHMRLSVIVTHLLLQLEPSLYRKYIQVLEGKPILSVKLHKAFCEL